MFFLIKDLQTKTHTMISYNEYGETATTVGAGKPEQVYKILYIPHNNHFLVPAHILRDHGKNDKILSIK